MNINSKKQIRVKPSKVVRLEDWRPTPEIEKRLKGVGTKPPTGNSLGSAGRHRTAGKKGGVDALSYGTAKTKNRMTH